MTQEYYEFDCGCKIPIVHAEKKECDSLPSLVIPYDEIIYNLNYGKVCPEVFKLLNEGQTKGVFQLESYLGKDWSRRLEPDTMEEWAALIALIRPGALRGMMKDKDGNEKSMTERYVDRKHKKERTEDIHSSLNSILSPTQSVMVFQEQAMQIATRIAGFSEQEADKLRKAIGKKKADVMAEVKKIFIEGCEKKGIVTNEEAEYIFGIIQESQRYSFNKCVSGKETIKKSAKGKHSFNPTIEEMYKIRNDIEYAKRTGHLSLYKKWKRLGNYAKGWSLCSDGRIRPNAIKDIIYQGKRETLTIHLSDGKTITTTSNHKFPTSKGIILSEDIQIGDCLYVCGEYEKTDFKPLAKFSNKDINSRFHKNTYDGQGFPAGEDNPSYTNGGHTSFQNFRNKTSDICCICQSTDNIETDHINGDRTNNDWSNLQKLCSSCHKKKEYYNGRTKRGEKGYPYLKVKVVKITNNDAEDVYDVVMDEPSHNFAIDNGIITCNSHSVGYGMTGYLTAYVKAHFPLHFFCSWLYYARDKIDPQREVKDLVSDTKNFDINVYGPDIKYIGRNHNNVAINNNHINFGMVNVKRVGKAMIDKFVDKATEIEKEFNVKISNMSWIQFLIYVSSEVSKTTMNGLIMSGALDHFAIGRNLMNYEYTAYSKLTKKEISNLRNHYYNLHKDDSSLEEILISFSKLERKDGGPSSQKRRDVIADIIDLLKNPPYSRKDTQDFVIKTERELFGVPLTCSAASASHYVPNTTCKEFNDGKNVKRMSMCGEITRVKEHLIKSGGKLNGMTMAWGAIEDDSGSSDFVVFSDVWEDNGHMFYENNCVFIEGGRSDKNSLIVNKVIQV